MRRRSAAVLATAVGAAVMVAPAAYGVPDGSASRLPSISPTPQSMQQRGHPVRFGHAVALVTGKGSDPAAIRATRDIAHAVGARTVTRVDDPSAVPPRVTEIYVGGPAENPATASVLRRLHVRGAGELPAEGYVIATGKIGPHDVVVLDGHDGAGTFYAAQTLRQLVGEHGGLPGVVVRDWPAYAVRGTIEGFYGTPWSHGARLSQLDFYGAHKMNTYVYSPKNDPYLREKWRQPYPGDTLSDLTGLVDRAEANHVKFTYALSPGLSICYSSAEDEQALVAKFQSLWDIGVRDFAIPLDDISYTDWNCDADKAKFGTGGAAAGAAQAYLLNEVQRDFVATHDGAARLRTVPTEYSDTESTGYKKTLHDRLDPDVIVEWTGVGVVPATITRQQAAAAKEVFGHDMLLWDNYPVNDYATGRLMLGPYVGRESGMSESLVGITANPMIQPEASKIALFSVADFAWNDAAYDPQRSWRASMTEFAHGDAEAGEALAAFADLEHYSRIDTVQAPALRRRVDAFWESWQSGGEGAAQKLDRYLRVIESARDTLSTRLDDPAFVAEAEPWLGSASAWGGAARAAVRSLVDERDGDDAAAAADRKQAKQLVAKAKSFVYVGLDGERVPVLVGDGVLDTFIDRALAGP